MAKKSLSDSVNEGDIYYRYRGRSEKIKYPEIIDIIKNIKMQIQKEWMNHIERIAKIGVRNSAIFYIANGKVTGKGGTFIIDKSLLSSLEFIREGQFNEKKGKPTLKLIGELQSVNNNVIQPTKIVTRTKSIRTPDIFFEFLNQIKVKDPIEYLKQICYESSAFLPVYYYIKLAKISRKKAIKIVGSEISRSQSKQKLKERLQKNESLAMEVPNTGTKSAAKKTEFRNMLLNKNPIIHTQKDDLKYLLKSVRSLKKQEINKKYLFPNLKSLFEKYYTDRTVNVADDIRKAICHIDILLNYEI